MTKNLHIKLALAAILAATTLQAQRNKTDKADLVLGAMPSLASIPRVDNGLKNPMLGGKIGAQFHNRKEETVFPAWSMGLYATFLTPQSDIEGATAHNIDVESAKLCIRDAGLFVEPVAVKICEGGLFEEATPQFYISLPVYWGLLSEIRIYDYDAELDERELIEKSNFMKIEPGINLNLALSKFALLSGGVSYQWTYLWDRPLENIQEWPDLGIFKINMSLMVRISLFN